MALLVPRIFGNEVEIFAADNKSAVHFCRDDCAGEDATADRDEAGKWTFLV